MLNYINAYLLFPLLEKVNKREIHSKLRELKEFEKLSRVEQKKIQKNKLFEMLVYCKAEIPFYNNLFKKHSFDPDKVLKDTKYLLDLPILTKDIVRENSTQLRLPSAVHERKTGGSTGQSVFFYYDSYGLDWTSAINLQAYDMAYNFKHKKDCHISSELGIVPPSFKAKFLDWLKLFSQNRSRLMINSFSEKDLEKTLKQLKRIRPYLLQGHPSSAYAIAEFIKSNNGSPSKYCAVFEPSGEMLTPKIIKSLEENLGCKVVNRYGNAEFGVIAHSLFNDPPERLKIFERAFFVEETNGSEMIITNFTNKGMPLIRYNTGDIATVKEESNGRFIYSIQGRIHDIVNINGEEYATHYIMDYLDHKIRGVREFQIIILNEELPILNIVPENLNDVLRIESEVKARWPKGLSVKFINFSDLEKVGWREKFRHVIDRRSR
ncbi:MAG: hypothetical protein CMJ16_03195 [Peredibacter sp.]|nr:hypothetical protein [Peredibacter sp.]